MHESHGTPGRQAQGTDTDFGANLDHCTKVGEGSGTRNLPPEAVNACC